jgi:diguanylate cyclase (GGDEF)-like protein
MAFNLKENTPHVADTLLSRVTQEFSRLEKRDRELWLIVVLSGLIASCGLVFMLFPSVFRQQSDLYFEIKFSKWLFFGALALLILLNTYIAVRRLELRRARRNLVSTSIQSELIRLQSFTDPLTEVYNRRSLDEMAARFISRARRTKEPLTFLVIDLDRFKEVNTRFGHITGDFVLAEVAGILKSSTRGSDAVVRYGGDEFLIVLGNTSKINAGIVVKRIHDYLSRWNKRNNLDKLELTVSVGVAEWEDGKTLDEVLDAADQDMYAIKNGPAMKPRLAAFNPKVSRHASARQADRFAQEARPNG